MPERVGWVNVGVVHPEMPSIATNRIGFKNLVVNRADVRFDTCKQFGGGIDMRFYW